jgi:protein TonB
VAPVHPLPEAAFTAPLLVPDRVVDEATDLAGGVEGGVPGGVEGGVPGGVIGGVVGGLPQAAAPLVEPAPVVRVGGKVAPPKLVHSVRPEYPEVARMAHLAGVVVLEALVGTDGRVESVKVLDANPVLGQVATDAVAQWRYKPLLLNGVPTRFLVTVTITFSLQNPLL